MKKRGVLIAWIVILGLFVGCAALLITFKSGPKTNYDLYGLPVLDVSLNDTTLTEINEHEKSIRYNGNRVTFYNGSEMSHYDDVTIKGRGNFTWTQNKKPYQIDLNQKVNLLGLGKRSKWILLANSLDVSHLRNDLAFYLARMVGEDFALNGEPIELVIDGANLGLYFMTPKIEVSKNSVDLRNEMGVIMELDNYNDVRDQEFCYSSVDGNCLIVNDAVNRDNPAAAAEDFMAAYNEFETAAKAGDYEKVQSLIDVESFVRYFLISEFAVNPDAYVTSWHMYKDGAGDKIHAGPVWDFDLAFGNELWQEWTTEDGGKPYSNLPRRAEAFGGEYVDENGEIRWTEGNKVIAKTMYYLLDMPEFYNEVKRVYAEKMVGHKSEVLAYLTWRADNIYVAATENNTAWEQENFETAVEFLYNFVAQRYDFLDTIYGDGNIEKIVQEL